MWETRDESDNFAQKHDVSLAKDKIRPSVVEEIRKQVWHGIFNGCVRYSTRQGSIRSSMNNLA